MPLISESIVKGSRFVLADTGEVDRGGFGAAAARSGSGLARLGELLILPE